MSDNSGDSILQNRDHLFTFLTAIIKREGGVLKVTEEEIASVERNDLVSVKYDPANNLVIFEVTTLDGNSGYSTDPSIRKDN